MVLGLVVWLTVWLVLVLLVLWWWWCSALATQAVVVSTSVLAQRVACGRRV